VRGRSPSCIAAQLTPVLRSNPNYFPAHAGLVEKLRNEFAASIAASFSRVRLAQIARWLDIKPADVPAWCKEAGWSVDGELAGVPENGANNVKAGVVKENVQLKRRSAGEVALTARAHQARRGRGVLDYWHAWCISSHRAPSCAFDGPGWDRHGCVEA
jgi:hypothetical protein